MEGKEIISIHADSPFHSKEHSDLTLCTMIGAGRRKNTRQMKLIRLKGKLILNQLDSNLRECLIPTSEIVKKSTGLKNLFQFRQCCSKS